MSNTKESKAVATTPKAGEAFVNPFAKRDHGTLNRGAVAIEEQRAVTEAMGKLYLAKSFPRDEAAAFEKVIASCQRPSMASEAEYAYPRGGETVSGPSIRLAEEMARAWGNIEYGIRELSEDEDSTEMEAFCWDLETNVLSTQKFRVKKERKSGGATKRLTDARDIYEMNANLGSRRLRARILAVLPPDLKEAALAQCKETLKPKKEELPARVKTMVAEFAKYKVTQAHLEAKQGKKADKFTADDFTALVAIYNSLKDGFSKPADWFEGVDPGQKAAASDGAAGDLNAAIAGDKKE